jgi:hypothetical protein
MVRRSNSSSSNSSDEETNVDNRPDRSHPGRPPQRPPLIQQEYYYRPRPVVRSDKPPVRADDFIRRTGGMDGRLVLRFTAVTPLYIGTGLTGLEGGRAIMLTARQGAVPVIPGSGLKGALRTIAEALSRSCPDQRCRMCFPCLVFGSVGYLARANFGPAVPEATPPPRPLGFMLPMRTSRGPTWNEARIRLYNHRKAHPDPTGVELVETLPIGTTLTSEIHYRSLSPVALGFLLLITGGAKGYGFLQKVGAAKSQGLGSVKVEIVSHKQRPVRPALPPNGEVDGPDSEELVKAYLDLEKPQDPQNLLTETLDTLREKSRPMEVQLP